MEINLKEICAICKYAASNEETRYYLNGVFVHTDETWVYFVATDGQVLIVHRTPNTDRANWSFIIPRTMLEKFRFSKRDTGSASLFHADKTVMITHDGTTSQCPEVDGTFPDYKRVRPVDGAEIQPTVFPGQRCADMDALAKAFGTVAIITPRGNDLALVTFGRDDMYGALLPVLKRETLRPFASRAPF